MSSPSAIQCTITSTAMGTSGVATRCGCAGAGTSSRNGSDVSSPSRVSYHAFAGRTHGSAGESVALVLVGVSWMVIVFCLSVVDLAWVHVVALGCLVAGRLVDCFQAH